MVGKTFPVFVLALALMAATASAGMTPQPVSVFVKNDGLLSGYEVSLTNLDTGDTVTVVTDSAGFQIYDWTNTNHGGRVGNQMKAVVLACAGQPRCTAIKSIEPTAVNPNVGKPVVFNMDVTGAVCAVCAKCESCAQRGGDCICNCPGCVPCPEDVTPYGHCDSCCAEAPADVTPYDKCDSCCAEGGECPADSGGILAYLIGAGGASLAAVALWLGKVKITGKKGEDDFSKALASQMSPNTSIKASCTKNADGTKRVLPMHVHPGISGYHSPDITHTKPEYRHERGKWVV